MPGKPVKSIIHQIWLQDSYTLTDSNKSWTTHNPAYTYMLWSETKLIDLMRSLNLYEFYNKLTRWISRLDFAKYVVLYKYGGVYADIDTQCVRSLDSLIEQYNFDYDLIVSEAEPVVSGLFVKRLYNLDSSTTILNSGVMIGKKNSRFLKKVIHLMKKCDTDKITSNYSNIDILGPIALSRYVAELGHAYKIVVLDYDVFESPYVIDIKSYAIHLHHKSWDNNNDVSLVMEGSKMYAHYMGWVIASIVGSAVLFYAVTGDVILSALFSMLCITLYFWIENRYVEYYRSLLNPQIKKLCIDGDRFYNVDDVRFGLFENIRRKWSDIKAEAMAVWLEAPVSESIKRDYVQWKELDEAYSSNIRSHYGWIKAWSNSNTDTNDMDKSGNAKWLNYGLFHNGDWFEQNATKCPITAKLLAEIRDRINIAGFSLMKGVSRIEKHTDTTGKSTNSLAYHLGLVVPDPPNSCILNVDGMDIAQQEGSSIVFDSNFEHYAVNDSAFDRIILYVDFKLGS